MNELTLQRSRVRLTRELTSWQWGAIGLLILAGVHNAACTASLMDARDRMAEQTVQLQQAESARDYAVEQLGAAVLQAEADKQARADPSAEAGGQNGPAPHVRA